MKYLNTPATDYKIALILALVAISLTYGLAFLVGWITGVVFLEAAAVFTAYACTYLCVRQRRWQYAVGMVSTILFALLFWQVGLIASALLNVYLTIQLIYGWFRWGKDNETRPVTHVSWKMIPVYIIATVAMYFGGVWVLTAAGGALAGWDILILLGSLLAQWLLDNKKIETWYVWTAVNWIQIPVYFSIGLPLTAIQYVLFLGMNAWGWKAWNEDMQLDKVPADLYAEQQKNDPEYITCTINLQGNT